MLGVTMAMPRMYQILVTNQLNFKLHLKLYYALARPLHQFYNMGALQLLSSAYIPYGEQALVN